MKIDSVYEIERTASFKGENEFSMKMTGKAFDIMTAGLYSDRIGSTVRELSTNASDSHMSANKRDVPFRISVPTVLDPHFVVYDEGTGMHPDQIKTHFVTLFDSSKDTSNDAVGAFGLGSKTPFSLTDTYTVEGRWNGMKHLFVMFKNERRVPAILETGAFPTDEPNGITIKVPVSADNYGKFIQAIKNQLHLFDPKPIITNVDDFEWHDTPVFAKHLETEFYKHDKWANDFKLAKFSVSMGKIIYPVDLQQLDTDLKDRMSRLSSNSISRFEIGDLDIQPSREGLSYDDATKYMLNTYFAALMHEYDMKIIENVKGAANVFEAWKLYRTYADSDSYWKNYPKPVLFGDADLRLSTMKMELPRTKYSVKVLDRDLLDFETNQAKLNAEATDTQFAPVPVESKHYKLIDKISAAFEMRHVKIQSAEPIWEQAQSWHNVSFSDLQVWPQVQDKSFILMDNDKNIRRKVKQYLLNSTFKRATVIYMSSVPDGASNIKSPTFDQLKAAFDEYYPGFRDRCIYLSEIENPKVERGPKIAGRVEGIRLLSQCGYIPNPLDPSKKIHQSYFVEKMELVLPHHPYVLMDGMNALVDYRGDVKENGMKDLADKAGFSLYGVLKGGITALPRLQANGNVEFSEWIKAVLQDYWLDDDVATYFGLKNTFNGVMEAHEDNWAPVLLKHYPNDPYLKAVTMYFKSNSRYNGGFKDLFGRKMRPEEEILNWIITNKHLEKFKDVPGVKKFLSMSGKNKGVREVFYKQYPLVHNLISLVYWSDMVPNVVSYMKMVDAQGQK